MTITCLCIGGTNLKLICCGSFTEKIKCESNFSICCNVLPCIDFVNCLKFQEVGMNNQQCGEVGEVEELDTSFTTAVAGSCEVSV